MREYMFGLGNGKVSDEVSERVDAIAREHGAAFVPYKDPGIDGSERYWFAARNRGNPFDQQTRDAAVYRAEDMQGDYPLRGAWCLASLGMVGVNDTHDPYLRVCAAELFVEALATLDAEDQREADKLAERATYAG